MATDTFIKKKKPRLVTTADVNGRVTTSLSLSVGENYDLMEFIDKYAENRKVTRNQAIRDILYHGKTAIIAKGLDEKL